MGPKTERFELRVEDELMERIDAWRASQADLPTRAEAFRRLTDLGLGRPEDKRLFQIARFNLLSSALRADSGIPDSYAFAWDRKVYPLMSRASGFHEVFADQFDVPEQRVDELSKLLDDAWRAKKVPSFYRLETIMGVRRGGTGFWDRSNLVGVCRYLFLDESFDAAFWAALLSTSDHPTEAKSIVRKFVPSDEIFLA